MEAVTSGDPDCVKLVLSKGANITSIIRQRVPGSIKLRSFSALTLATQGEVRHTHTVTSHNKNCRVQTSLDIGPPWKDTNSLYLEGSSENYHHLSGWERYVCHDANFLCMQIFLWPQILLCTWTFHLLLKNLYVVPETQIYGNSYDCNLCRS